MSTKQNNILNFIPLRRFFLVGLALLGIVTLLPSQITTNNTGNYGNIQYLVEDVFLGAGVTASNFSFTGDVSQIGFFNGLGTNIGLDSGLVICSDEIDQIIPNNWSNSLITGLTNSDLLTVANSVPPLIGQSFSVSSVNDYAALEFDFMPMSDTVNFRFVFGSDEYLTFVNTSFNDVFAFFISGPGITGPYASPSGFPGGAKNIALVPGSAPPLPITISSINDVLNSAYYVDNPNNTTVGLNGFTTVLNASSGVQCGQTYHIRLAIADGGDSWLESAVFLEAASFSAGSIVLTASPSYSTNNATDTVLYEGCGDVKLTLKRNGQSLPADTIRLSFGGTAINGIDYINMPDSIVFQAGQDSASFIFVPAADTLNEGSENLIIRVIEDTSSCGFIIGDSIVLSINDPIPLVISTINDTMNCWDDSLAIFAHVESGIGRYHYQWSIGAPNLSTDSTDTNYVNPIVSQDFYITVTDGCNIYQDIDTVHVHVIETQVFGEAENTFLQCPGDATTIEGSVWGGITPHQIWWSNNPAIHDTFQTVTPDTTTVYTLMATDYCMIDTVYIDVLVSVPEFTPLRVDAGKIIQALCPGQPAAFKPKAEGGSGGYHYTWDNWATTDTLVNAKPIKDTLLLVGLTDFCATDTVYDTVWVVVQQHPLMVSLSTDSIRGCEGDVVHLGVIATGGSGNYTYLWNTPKGNTDSITVIITKSQMMQVVVRDECNTKDTSFTYIEMAEPKAGFRTNHWDLQEVEFINQSSEDVIFWAWDFGDGSTSRLSDPVHSYLDDGKFQITLAVENALGCRDSIAIEIAPPITVWVPNIFTANNDGLNDELIISSVGVINFQIEIMNRWGQRVYFSTDPNQAWDGKHKGTIVPQGIYVYELSASGYGTKKIHQKGVITVLSKN